MNLDGWHWHNGSARLNDVCSATYVHELELWQVTYSVLCEWLVNTMISSVSGGSKFYISCRNLCKAVPGWPEMPKTCRADKRRVDTTSTSIQDKKQSFNVRTMFKTTFSMYHACLVRNILCRNWLRDWDWTQWTYYVHVYTYVWTSVNTYSMHFSGCV